MSFIIDTFNLHHFGKKKDRKKMIKRIRLIKEDTPSWGSMNAHQLVVHMTDIMRVALGEKEAAMNNSWWAKLCRVSWIRPLILLLPWPPGIPAQPEFLEAEEGTPLDKDFEADRARLIEAVEKMGRAEDCSEPLHPHPVFGKMTEEEWQRLMYHHVRHHLCQLGLFPLGL